jgi:hypothetical protein
LEIRTNCKKNTRLNSAIFSTQVACINLHVSWGKYEGSAFANHKSKTSHSDYNRKLPRCSYLFLYAMVKLNGLGTMCTPAATWDLDCSFLQTKCYYWQTKIFISSSNVVRGCSQLSTFSLAYSFSWTLPHPESVQDDDPAISSGDIVLLCFRFSPLVAKPRIRLNWKLVGELLLFIPRGTYKFWVNSSQLVFQDGHLGGYIWSPIEPKFGRNVGGV